jgi:hypothetical protein
MASLRQRRLVALIIVSGFVLSGWITYLVGHWYLLNGQRISWLPYQSVGRITTHFVGFGWWGCVGVGLLLGVCVAAVHAQRWLLLPVSLLLLGLGVMALVNL